jgi:hypothetical protein
MLSGDERDRTANLLVANQALYVDFIWHNLLQWKALRFTKVTATISSFWQIIAEILMLYGRFAATAELDTSMGMSSPRCAGYQ